MKLTGKTLDMSHRIDEAQVARLATIDPDGRPHLVPIVFAVEGDTLYSAVDRKPKRSTRLRRIENARARPDVTVLVDHYDDDWTRLWWICLRGRARVLDDGDECERALALLLRSTRSTARSRPTACAGRGYHGGAEMDGEFGLSEASHSIG